MRGKEEADDYRYFPEPDLVHVEISDDWIEEIQPTLPELPAARRERFISDYGISSENAEFLTSTRQLAEFFDEAAQLSGEPTACANWMMGDLTRLLNTAEIEIQDSRVTPAHLNELIQLIEDATISGKIAKSVLDEAFESGKMPKEIVSEKGLAQITDTSEIEAIVLQVVEENPGPCTGLPRWHKESDRIPCRAGDARYSRESKPTIGKSDFGRKSWQQINGILPTLQVKPPQQCTKKTSSFAKGRLIHVCRTDYAYICNKTVR